MEKIGYLSKIDLFCELKSDDLKELERIGPMNTADKGQIILSPGSENKGVYLLKKGFVRLYRLNEQGKELTVSLLGSGNIFGELDTFSVGIREVFVEALSECVLCVLHKLDFEEFILQRPKVVLKLLEVMSRRANEAEGMLEQIAFSDVKTRLGRTLLKLAEDFGTAAGEYIQLDVPLTNQMIAHMIGSTRETVTGILAGWVKQEIVIRKEKSLLIHKPNLEFMLQG